MCRGSRGSPSFEWKKNRYPLYLNTTGIAVFYDLRHTLSIYYPVLRSMKFSLRSHRKTFFLTSSLRDVPIKNFIRKETHCLPKFAGSPHPSYSPACQMKLSSPQVGRKNSKSSSTRSAELQSCAGRPCLASATQNMPALFAAEIPAWESSKTTQRSGSTFNRFAASR